MVAEEDDIGVKGHLTIESRPKGSDSDEDWEEIVDTDNLVVDVGRDRMRDVLQGQVDDEISDFCFGTDGTNAAAGDTDLGNEVHRENFNGFSDVSTGESQWTGVLDSVEPSGQPYDLAEFGVKFNDGTLLARTTFVAETKDTTQEWRVRYNLSIT